jgi:hypothetical protein
MNLMGLQGGQYKPLSYIPEEIDKAIREKFNILL